VATAQNVPPLLVLNVYLNVPLEVVVPVASIAQIRIGKAEPQQRPGFSLPSAE